ncbi:WGR domain-containing protein [Ectothiorhodospiraceae bacterium BW-2]|nr:WGR domain-containing protein [Ectothiorhodospiraceae bacterium BW-2]
MRIYMQTRPDEGNQLRFYQLQLQRDMFGGWSMIREWGVQGSSGTVKRTHFDEFDKALAAMMKLRSTQLKRGYYLMFVNGDLPELRDMGS